MRLGRWGSTLLQWGLAAVSAAVTLGVILFAFSFAPAQTLHTFSRLSFALFGDGSAAAPSVAGMNYPSTGLFWSAGPTLNFSVNGVLVATLDQNGTLTVVGLTPAQTFRTHISSMYIGIDGSALTAPGPPQANGWYVFLQNNSAGKNQLCVQFSSGAAQCFATQP